MRIFAKEVGLVGFWGSVVRPGGHGSSPEHVWNRKIKYHRAFKRVIFLDW
jgi:hypothetical protein